MDDPNAKEKPKAKPKKKAPKEPEEDWMATISEITDLTLGLSKFIQEKMEFNSCDEVLRKAFFTELKPYVLNLHETILMPDTSTEEIDRCKKVMYALCRFVSPAFEERQFLKSLLAMRVTGWMNLMLKCPKMELKTKELLCQYSMNHLKATPIFDHLLEGVHIMDYLLDLALDESNTSQKEIKSYIKRLLELKEFLKMVNFMEEPMDLVRSKLYSCLTSLNFVKCKEGPTWMGLVLSRQLEFVKPTQEKIQALLISLNKKEAAAYGEVYFHAWTNADEETKTEIEEKCIQSLMQTIFTLKRNGIEMGRTGKIIFSILENMHSLRSTVKFSQMITKLYTPLIWRSLKSSNPAERCNAAEVFLDVFPLEKVGTVENSVFKERQLKEIKDLLLDDCHVIRVIAIKKTCFHLGQSVQLFNLLAIKELYQILADKLANDKSTYRVRSAVFEGFASMLDYPVTHSILFNLLPTMYLHIHDDNENVRKSFVKILIKVRDLEDCGFNYWDIVPINHIVARLVEEGPLVGKELAKLILPDFYQKHQTVHKTLSRLKKLIKIHKDAPKLLFKYSNSVLDARDAYSIIVTVIGILRKILKTIFDNPDVENKSPTEEPVRNRRPHKKAKVLNDINNFENSNEQPSPNPSEAPTESTRVNNIFEDTSMLEDHGTVMAMLSAVAILWAQFADDLNEDANQLNDLHSLSCAAIPMLLRYYRGTPVYHSIVDFASLVPISKLTPVTTVSSACISELKEITDETPHNVIQLLVFALSSWNRGVEIIDLIIDWLNHAFRQQDLNRTTDMTKNKNTKVRFMPVEGKPRLALTLLEHLVGDIFNLKRLLNKRYDRLLDLHTYMARIQIILEKRAKIGLELKEKDLTDEFLIQCYSSYLSLGVFLHRTDNPETPLDISISQPPSLTAPKFFIETINWAIRNLLPFLPIEPDEDGKGKDDIGVKCINRILHYSSLVISIDNTDSGHSTIHAAFLSSLLDKGCAVYFIEMIAKGIKQLSEYSPVYLPQDDWSLLNTILPSLQSRLLELLAIAELSSSSIHEYVKDVKAFKACLFSFLMVTYSVFKEGELFNKLFNYYIFTVLQVISKQISKENSVINEKKLENHQFIVHVILKYFTSKPVLLKKLFPVINEHITSYKSDGTNLLSCVSLIYTLVHVFKAKVISNYDLEIESCMKNAHECLKSFETFQTENAPEHDSFFDSEPLNVAKCGLSVLKEAASLTCFADALD